jgi:hypothetical protein
MPYHERVLLALFIFIIFILVTVAMTVIKLEDDD